MIQGLIIFVYTYKNQTINIKYIFLQIKETQMTKQKLMSNRAKLEADIKIKNKSLKIDQHQCLSNRKTFPAITLTKNL